MPADRSRRAQLQAIVGPRGSVEWVAIPSLRRPAYGWWLLPTTAVEGCSCEWCAGARAGRAVFVAGGALLGATVLTRYAAEHPEDAARAPKRARHPEQAGTSPGGN